MNTNITELAAQMRGLAEACDNWKYETVKAATEEDDCQIGHTNEDGEFYDLITLDCENYDLPSKPLADYIAALSPEVCITILDALEAAQANATTDAILLEAAQDAAKRMMNERDAAQAEVAKQKHSITILKSINDIGTACIKELEAERDAALARLAEIEKQEQPSCSNCKHNKYPYENCDGCEMQKDNPANEGNWEAAGASPVQPSQKFAWADVGRLIGATDQARAAGLLVGTSNWGAFVCKAMGAQPSQAVELSFEEIEDCFPEGNFQTIDAQWLHNYAYAIIAAINAKGAGK